MKRIRERVTYANVMATVAVFIALGGASYAAIKIPEKSVGTKQLKNGAVTQAKLGQKVKKSLAKAGAAGPAGPAGAAGAAGAPGSARAYAYVDWGGEIDPAHSKGVLGVSAPCPGGEPTECTSPPAGEPTRDYCFKLGFDPGSVSVTPRTGRIYADDAGNRFEAQIPGRSWSELRGGCAPGYRDAEVRIWQELTSNGSSPTSVIENEAFYGFYVVFY